MKELIEYILQLHPEFAEEIEGVTEKEIKAFESLCPYPPIPEAFRAFLKFMGRKSGRVKGIWISKSYLSMDKFTISEEEVDLTFDRLFNFYKLQKKKYNYSYLNIAEDYQADPKNFFMIALNPLGNDTGHFFLDLRSEKMPIVEISSTLEMVERSPSYEEFLFERPFRRTLSKNKRSKQWL